MFVYPDLKRAISLFRYAITINDNYYDSTRL